MYPLISPIIKKYIVFIKIGSISIILLYIEELKKYDKSDIWQARKIVQDLENEIYIGHIYEDKNRKSFMEVQENRKAVKTVLRDEVKHYDISKLI